MLFFKLFHKFFRKNVRPIAKDDALLWKQRLSKMYVFIAFNCFGAVIYTSYKHNLELVPKNDLEKNSVRFGRLAMGSTVHVIEFKGLTKSAEYEYKKEE